MKILKAISIFFKNIWKIIDKKIIVPITKLVVAITDKFEHSGKKVERWLSKSTTLLFIALFLALFVFIVIDQKVLLYSENSAEVLTGIPVTVKYNEEAYVVEGLPETVDVTLIGSSANLYFAKQSAAQDVEVDLSGLKPGKHEITLKYNQILPSITYQVNPSTVTIYIYSKVSETKTLSIDLLNQDSLDSKLVIDDVTVNNDKVVVKGADHQISKVATVKALVDIKDLVSQEVGKTTLKDVPLKAYDEDGNVVDVEIVPSKLDVDITISSPSKELPIRVVPTGTVSFGNAIASITTNEETVTVYGDAETLENLKYIPVEVSVDGLTEDRTYKLELPKPVGVKSMSVNNITVDVKLGKSSSREIEGIQIESKNLTSGYSVQGLSDSDIQVTVVLKGVESVINSIESTDIKAYIDLSGYEPGTYEVEVIVEGTDSRVEYVAKTKKVNITIKK